MLPIYQFRNKLSSSIVFIFASGILTALIAKFALFSYAASILEKGQVLDMRTSGWGINDAMEYLELIGEDGRLLYASVYIQETSMKEGDWEVIKVPKSQKSDVPEIPGSQEKNLFKELEENGAKWKDVNKSMCKSITLHARDWYLNAQ